jgi:hypothetical protein
MCTPRTSLLWVQRQTTAVRMILRFFRFGVFASQIGERHIHSDSCPSRFRMT